jgi:hypothetical protein
VKPHEFDPVSLLFGAVFFLIGGVILAGGTAVPGSHVGALWPIPVIGVGLIIVAMALRAVLRESS